MAAPSKPIEVYLEAGQKRTFGAAAAQCHAKAEMLTPK